MNETTGGGIHIAGRLMGCERVNGDDPSSEFLFLTSFVCSSPPSLEPESHRGGS